MARQPLGQHFLSDSSVLDRIAQAACPERQALVIEIGPGKGALTERLLERAERVVAVEIDAALADFLRVKFAAEPRLTVIRADALETDFGKCGGRCEGQRGPATIAGNLPYYVATPIIERVLALGAGLDRAVFLVQKEVAARLTAAPGCREYGYLSVQTQFFADAEALFDVPPAAFRPPPKVDSTLVRLTPNPRAAELDIADARCFLKFVGVCFRQKRKTLRNNLAAIYGKQSVDSWPESGKRAEQLTLPQLAALYRRLA